MEGGHVEGPLADKQSRMLPPLYLHLPNAHPLIRSPTHSSIPPGSGKSTLARLLFRFYDPLAGAVRFNGCVCHVALICGFLRVARLTVLPFPFTRPASSQDIKAFRQRSIRKAIGVVPQVRAETH